MRMRNNVILIYYQALWLIKVSKNDKMIACHMLTSSIEKQNNNKQTLPPPPPKKKNVQK